MSADSDEVSDVMAASLAVTSAAVFFHLLQLQRILPVLYSVCTRLFCYQINYV